MKAILVRPRFDGASEYSFTFAAEILQWCEQANINIIEVAEEDAIKARIARELVKGVELFIFYDHGSEDALIGQDEKAMIDLENSYLLANKEVYTLACSSAKNLGRDIWNRGGKFWGYADVVGFTTDALPAFQEAFNCGFRYRFIDGNTHEDSLNKAKETFNDLAFMLVDAGKTFAAICMRQNRDNLVYYNGNKPEEKEGCLLTLLKLPIRIFSHN